jgi:hypothetical protein
LHPTNVLEVLFRRPNAGRAAVAPRPPIVPAADSAVVSHWGEWLPDKSSRPFVTEIGGTNIILYARERLMANPSTNWTAWVQKHTPLAQEVTLPPEARTRIHRYRLGSARLLAFERNIDYRMSEDLKQAGGNENLEKPIELAARLEHPAHLYDLRAGKYLGRADVIRFHLDPWQPSLFALLPEKAPAEKEIVESLLNP